MNKIIALIVAVMALLIFCSCSAPAEEEPANPIVGTWVMQGWDYKYTFNADGTGKNEGMTESSFNWRTDGEKLTVDYGNSYADEYIYTIEKNTLNLVDTDNLIWIYERK